MNRRKFILYLTTSILLIPQMALSWVTKWVKDRISEYRYRKFLRDLLRYTGKFSLYPSILDQIDSVHPLDEPVGKVFYLDFGKGPPKSHPDFHKDLKP